MGNSYRLDASLHESVYEEEIEPAYFLTSSPVERPKLIIVGGQPGAGKTKVLEMAKKKFADNNVVIVNTDDLREYHPQFDELATADDKQCASHTHEDASGWNHQLLSRSIETRRNVILEGVFKNSQKLVDIAQLARNNGYEVTFSAVAVNERFSIWGIHKRYEKEKLAKEHGRFVPLDYHNECYQKLPETVGEIEALKMVDRLEIFTRDAVCLYSNELIEGKWNEPEGANLALETERARKLSAAERVNYEHSWEPVFEDMNKRSAPKEEIAEIKAIADRFIKEVRTD